MTKVTSQALNRATLQRQLLLGREPLDVVAAGRRVVAIQAQEPASPYVALWNRVAGFDAAELDRAFAEDALVKAPLMRTTLHAVVADDYPAFHAAVTPTLRAARLNDRRFRITGLTSDDADALVADLADFAVEPRSKADIEAHLAERLGDQPHEGVWWALRTFAPLVHAPSEPPWSFGRRPSFRAAPTSALTNDRLSHDDALRHLVVRCLSGFGPASVADFAQFTLTRMSVARPAFESLRDGLRVVTGPNGEELFDVVDAPSLPEPESPAPPRLMAMWDSILLAYADRSRVIPEQYRSLVIRRNGDTLPTVLVDGQVAGVWRPAEGGADEGVEVTAFHPFDDDTWSALEDEAVALGSFVADRDPNVYRRYGRWWADLPVAERRTLAAP